MNSFFFSIYPQLTMDSPTLWNIDDKSNYLSVESDGLKVIYKGVISFNNLKMSDIQQWHLIYVICISFQI